MNKNTACNLITKFIENHTKRVVKIGESTMCRIIGLAVFLGCNENVIEVKFYHWRALMKFSIATYNKPLSTYIQWNGLINK